MLTPARVGFGGYELFGLRVLATLAVATTSYRLIEMPVRRGAFRRWRASWTLAPSGAACLALAVVLVTRGAVSPAGAYSFEPMPQIDSSANPQPIRLMVVGDSVAQSMAPGLKLVGEEGERKLAVWDRSIPACGFLDLDKETDATTGRISKAQADKCRGLEPFFVP